MIYTAVVEFIDKAGDTCQMSFTQSDTEFTNAKMEALVSKLDGYSNCTVKGWSRVASDNMTLGTGIVQPETGNVDRKVVLPVYNEEGGTRKWMFPDPTGTVTKTDGQESETLDDATVTGIVTAIATLLGEVFTPTLCRLLQRL